jgi:hypothetical protein
VVVPLTTVQVEPAACVSGAVEPSSGSTSVAATPARRASRHARWRSSLGTQSRELETSVRIPLVGEQPRATQQGQDGCVARRPWRRASMGSRPGPQNARQMSQQAGP